MDELHECAVPCSCPVVHPLPALVPSHLNFEAPQAPVAACLKAVQGFGTGRVWPDWHCADRGPIKSFWSYTAEDTTLQPKLGAEVSRSTPVPILAAGPVVPVPAYLKCCPGRPSTT